MKQSWELLTNTQRIKLEQLKLMRNRGQELSDKDDALLDTLLKVKL